MSDALSFAEIDSQHVELLPARTVLSLFTAGGGGTNNCSQHNNTLGVAIPILSGLNLIGAGDPSAGVLTGNVQGCKA